MRSNVVGNRTVCTFLEFHAATRPHETALITETHAGIRQWFTWSELDTLANQTANWLLSQGLKQGESVLLHFPNSLESYLSWLAAAKIGTVVVPVDPGSTEAELGYLIEHSEARLLITQPSTSDLTRAASASSPCLQRIITASLDKPFFESEMGAEIRIQNSARPTEKVDPLSVLTMLYTSGTTGRPKAVMMTHAAYLYGAEVFARATRLGPQDRHLISLPLHHAAAQCHAMAPSLVAGASLAIVERFSASRFLQQAIRYSATRAALFSAPLRMLLRHYAGLSVPRSPLNLVTFAQNLALQELNEWETKFGIPLMQLWGMTETVGLPLMAPLNGPRDNMCMGLPVLGYDVKVVDYAGNDVSTGSPGEIVVRAMPGWNVTLGYFKNPQATSELIRDGWLHSGDRAVQDEKGQFHFLGRIKEIIKRSGENISPLEVEEALRAHAAIRDAAVLGLPDPVRDERVIAFVIFREGKSANDDELKEWCRRRLSSFKIPEEFNVCDEFPRTSVGKIQKHILREARLQQQSVDA